MRFEVCLESGARGWHSSKNTTERKIHLSQKPATASVLVIGDEILSGRTKDKNIGSIADRLQQLGIDLVEVRIVRDEQTAIVEALNALRAASTYVFTTGGIGPTHDDITADSVAAAFGVSIDVDPRAVEMMRSRYPNGELNEARLRMARIPHGADLIENSISKAPGFRIGNVFVLAGVPSIMNAMFDALTPQLDGGVEIHSFEVETDLKEGDIAKPLGQLDEAYSDVSFGSYPGFDGTRFWTRIVARSRNPASIEAARLKVRDMIDTVTAEH